jgi:hypothetical protein
VVVGLLPVGSVVGVVGVDGLKLGIAGAVGLKVGTVGMVGLKVGGVLGVVGLFSVGAAVGLLSVGASEGRPDGLAVVGLLEGAVVMIFGLTVVLASFVHV